MFLCSYCNFLLTQGNVKLWKELEFGFEKKFGWNKYESKKRCQTQNRYLDFLIDLSFQGVNRLFILLFKDGDRRKIYKQCYLPTVERKDL